MRERAGAAEAASHFKLCVLAVVSQIVEAAAVSFGSSEALVEQLPFLAGYVEEIAAKGEGAAATDAVAAFEEGTAGHLPLRALRAVAALDARAVGILLTVGLVEEDARFGALFDALQDGTSARRPTLGLLNAWWRDDVDGGEVRASIRRLRELGLVHVANPDAPRMEWALSVPALVWDALRGDASAVSAPWLRYHPPASLASLEDLVLPSELRDALGRIPALAAGRVQPITLRGPSHNGRRTAFGALARATGRGVLEVVGLAKPDDERWRPLGALATLLHAAPVLVLTPASGETIELPSIGGYEGPLGIVLGKHGGVSGPGAEGAIGLAVPMPDVKARRAHWAAGFANQASPSLDAIAGRFRMTSGNIRRAASLAAGHAVLRGGSTVEIDDVRTASRTLHRQALDTLALRLEGSGGLGQLAVTGDTRHELEHVILRCRHRERVEQAAGSVVGGQGTLGVKVLFQGPSGTGKTFAARLLAAELGLDLYRVDLSSVVNKYIGETEKNLNQAFSLAEELDVVLLLDEGDALLTRRTAVQTSNDRYANLETNYLLQRIESFEGILIVTTNAGDLIDSAFQRRMDVVVGFRLPDVAERMRIWQLHLPENHGVGAGFLREIATRCALSGGQIRNAVLYASLLAVDAGVGVDAGHLEAAVQREYRKTGGLCPLRRVAAVNSERA